MEDNIQLFELEIKFYFPNIPECDLIKILLRCQRMSSYKYLGYARAIKAVTAYIRHNHTNYDFMVSFDRRLARSLVQNKIEQIQINWGLKKGKKLNRENIIKFKKQIEEKKKNLQVLNLIS